MEPKRDPMNTRAAASTSCHSAVSVDGDRKRTCEGDVPSSVTTQLEDEDHAGEAKSRMSPASRSSERSPWSSPSCTASSGAAPDVRLRESSWLMCSELVIQRTFALVWLPA